mmetsp:Transcript_5585/g.25165  ORF Transcript_5585/g.25165 Transcript_5585/m.25165 type:complete len:299 (+) Transcript_5585:238-1134(+)
MTPISLSLVTMLITLPNHATALMAATSGLPLRTSRPAHILTSVDASIIARSVADDDRANGLLGNPSGGLCELVASNATRASLFGLCATRKWMRFWHHTRLYALSLSRALNENQSLTLERSGRAGMRYLAEQTLQLVSRLPLVRMETFCHWRRHLVCTNSWEPVQSHGAMSSPRSGPAKQNLQEFVGSQNRHSNSSSSSSSAQDASSGRWFWSRMSPGTSFASVKRQEFEQHRVGGLAGSSISRSRASLSATQWLRSSQSVRPVPMKMSPARDMAYAFAGMPRFLEAEKLYTAVITSED